MSAAIQVGGCSGSALDLHLVMELLVTDSALNAGVVAATLSAVEELGRLEVGREAMLLAGRSVKRLSNFLNAVTLCESINNGFSLAGVKDVLEELGKEEGGNGVLARQLLVCYTVQLNHVE